MNAASAVIELVEMALASRSMTLHRISKKCGVGYSTLRRLMQNESTPAESTVTSIVTGLLPRQEAAAFFRNHYPALANKFVLHEESGYQHIADEAKLQGRHSARDG
ncbi:MAG: hypothetical protein EOO38_20590 [Cytophagaceae bacterium]|nr:MAG: hypothetical protein EOO38_20590 [Cytophagaceae bacterium]